MYAVTMNGEMNGRQGVRNRIARERKTRVHRISSRVRRRRMSVIIFLIVVVVGLISWLPSMRASGLDQIITVQQGDTLWSIGERFAKPSDDIRDVILHMKDANHLTDDVVQPGMRLHIPQ